MYRDRESCYRALRTRDARFDGVFFVAVETTGIYCRPICPAQTPKLEHVTFVPTAAAAQAAGFRPCLRCRPETSPDLAAWHGTAATVSRAMSLIAAGALNDASVDDLAVRLGIGERQLRRLFAQHIGASPNAVAQTRRVLLAKQLITDTSMPMAQVALAAGFGSLRRFNDTFLSLYGRPPRSMRRARGAGSPASAITLTLPFKPPYDWPGIIGFLAARAIRGVESVQPDCYARSITLNGAQGTIALRMAERQNALIATIRFPVVTALPVIVARIRRMFDLGADPAVIGAQLAEDPIMAPLVAARPGLRVPGAWDGFELAVRGILGQQITVNAATALASKLVDLCGNALPPADDPALAMVTHAFPLPEDVARLPEPGLALGMPRARAAAITGLAKIAAADRSIFEPGRGLDVAIRRLRALPGIGEWTAHYIAMRALREPDAFPAGDIGLMRAMATGEGRPTAAQLRTHADAWRPWRAYATLHLWASDPVAPRSPSPASEKLHATVPRTRRLADRHDSPGL
jgi:AraC family transcriptional regulator, regulatory protein of adaptative response / DNA-3-methyladenine glycosylase II